jgi:hypothetical protein
VLTRTKTGGPQRLRFAAFLICALSDGCMMGGLKTLPTTFTREVGVDEDEDEGSSASFNASLIIASS